MNVSSVAGLQATPGNATYGASKAFVASFGEAVAGELAGTGVTLDHVLPGFTRPSSSERAGIGGAQDPQAGVAVGRGRGGHGADRRPRGRAWLVPGVLNKALVAAAGPVPRGLKRRMAAKVAKRV